MPTLPLPTPDRTVTLPLPLALRLLGALENHAPLDARVRLDGSLRDLERRIRGELARGSPHPLDPESHPPDA